MGHRTVASYLLAACALVAGASAGPLDPPNGPPAPTMKPLDQVEPRIAIGPETTPGDDDSLLRITQPGSYYLTGNVVGVPGKHGIEIASHGVRIDLMGFTLRGVAGSLSGILAGNQYGDLGVRNGVVTAWPDSGVDLAGNSAGSNALVESVEATGNGQAGIRTTRGAVVRSCTATANVGVGIFAFDASIVESCVANQNGGIGIRGGAGGVVRGCSARGNGVGIEAWSGCTVSDCSATDNESDGFSSGFGASFVNCTAASNVGSGFAAESTVVIDGCRATQNEGGGVEANLYVTITDCTLLGNDLFGITVTSACRVLRNTCDQTHGGGLISGAGVRATGTSNVIDENALGDNDVGLQVTGNNNFITRNKARANETNFSVGAGNELAPVVVNPGSNGFASMTPWSNVAY